MNLKLYELQTYIIIIFLLSGIMFKVPVVSNEDVSYPISVVDDFGRNVTIVGRPERIVSLAPSATEILFALNLGNKVVGVTKFCNYPQEVLDRVESGNLTVIGGVTDISMEPVIALAPDLIIATYSFQEETIELLEEQGLTVIGLNPKNLQQTLQDIRLVGLICGETENADQIVVDIQQRINYLTQRGRGASSRPRVYYEVWFDPLMSVGPETVQNELIYEGGGENIFADAEAPYPIISSEAVITRNPEIIIIPIEYMNIVKEEDFEKRPGWSEIDAIKNGMVYEVDEDLIVRPGPRVIKGLEQLALILHPERFTGMIEVSAGAVLETNSTITNAHYDETRMLLNFTAKGEDGTAGTMNATIKKTFLNGDPVVFMNGREIQSSFEENSTHYMIHFSYNHTIHIFTIGGVNTIPEFPNTAALLITIFLTLTSIVRLRKWRARSIKLE